MRLVQFVEYELNTDFALLFAVQTGGEAEPPGSMTFATSAPGAVAMTCGTRYAKLHVRLERWDERPPAATADWEDVDELPWVSSMSGGTVVAAGFDPPDDDAGLRVDDLPRARVQVHAKGRHRYDYSDGVPDDLPPENWLLRWWPDEPSGDALSGPPRRLAGSPPFWYPRTPWQAALHAWSLTGWHSKLLAVGAFREIESALSRLGRPGSADELAALWGPWGAERDEHGCYTLQTPVLGHPPRHDPPDFYIQPQLELLEALARAAEMRSIDTFGDALLALHRLDLLLVTAGRSQKRYVPNPSPTPVWEALDLSAESRHGLVTQALYSDYRAYEDDLLHLLRWAHNGRLDATPLTMAVRLGLPVHVVLGGLQLLQHLGSISIGADREPLERNSRVTVVRRR